LDFRIADQKAGWQNGGAFSTSLNPIREINQETRDEIHTHWYRRSCHAASATPALAQAVIEDPRYCAQFYLNANCQNLGPGNPYTDGGYFRNNWQNSNASVVHHRQRHRETHRR
jgi:hypothetical protein